MAMEVYSPTTAPNPKSSFFVVPTELLNKIRFLLKILEVLLSFVAFILEEVVMNCNNCSALYFFEFVSCTAFLFTLLLLILLSTKLHQKVNITCWSVLDFLYTAAMGVLFFIASIIFASQNSGTGLESAAVIFGFLAMAAFIADCAYFYKTIGLPFKSGGKPQPGNGVAAGATAGEADPPAETEKLNTANGGE
ncbi:CKLF-like MARVEL transmembrane domain-containing protein 6 [Mugil cephalus]|uniref:CKLF-like MARVEL transmembrane domain-containing protein 6 n=1 Tax=Mugil cephalus TaxID=48193 RepID=UPI001FB80403|nr:CKLF-like MARVEL transmembrane domain-containing protein 6 [Mugil cephalus]